MALDAQWRFWLIGAVGGNFSLAAQFAGRPLFASSPRLYPSIVLGNNYLGGGLSSSWNFGRYTQALSRSHNIGIGVIGSYTKDQSNNWLPAASSWLGYRWSTKNLTMGFPQRLWILQQNQCRNIQT